MDCDTRFRSTNLTGNSFPEALFTVYPVNAFIFLFDVFTTSSDMECDVCMEQFNAVERRPKVLPCGHTYCLRCLQQLLTRACPVDKQVFLVLPEELVDNFKLLNHTDCRPARFWCVTCEKEASAECVEEHAVCSLRKQRAAEARPHLEALQRGDAALLDLAKVLDACDQALRDCRHQLQREQAGLVTARERLQSSLQADEAVWEQAKQAVAQGTKGRSVCAAQLLVDLADPAFSCSLALRRGEEGDVAWSGAVRPATDAVLRLLLCVHACSSGLQPGPEGRNEETASQLEERSNVDDVEQEAAYIRIGSRVVRGRDWQFGNEDGSPPGPGTVVAIGNVAYDYNGEYYDGSPDQLLVLWDCDNTPRYYNMGLSNKYHLRELAPKLVQFVGTDGSSANVSSIAVGSDVRSRWAFLANTDLKQVRTVLGLHCDADPQWCQIVLQQVAPHLQSLQMVNPKQQHLDVVKQMPYLSGLSITNVTGEQLQDVSQMASLRRLELHCRLDAPLPLLTYPATAARLRWLRCGVHPLATALALVRAHADSLEELQLVAASTEPYGCRDLALQLQRCRPKKLKRMVLLRGDAYGEFCRHDEGSCMKQRVKIVYRFSETGLLVDVICNVCQSGQ